MPLFLRPRTKYKNRQLPPESPREASRAGGVTLPRYIYGPALLVSLARHAIALPLSHVALCASCVEVVCDCPF